MAEYVRRKRPPASHPYWARLHDRAHPPQVVLSIVIPTSFGLGVGLYGGLHPEYSSAEAAGLALEVAGASAGGLFVLAVLILRLDASRHTPRRERWTAAVVGAFAVSAGLFGLMFLATFLALLWYAACSGEGPWLGMLIGAAMGAGPAALIAFGARRRWRERQRRWPRWERMHSPGTHAVLTVTPVPAPPLSAPQPSDLWTRLGNSQ
jgi:MFS family permease